MIKKYRCKKTYHPSDRDIFVKGEYYDVFEEKGNWVDICLKNYYDGAVFHLQTNRPNDSYYLYDFMESNFIFGR